jgi:predicted AAA+ superfamily ATPase
MINWGHWRTHAGEEVDLVIEREDGRVAALEVKAGTRALAGELRGLLALRRKLGSRFLAGIVLYTGAHAYTHESGVHVVPISRLWHAQ